MRSIFFALVCAVLLCTAAQAASLSSVVAVVNGEMITSRELEKAIAPELATQRLDPQNPAQASQVQALRRQALDSMINEKVLMQEAERLGLEIPEESLDSEFDRIIGDSGMPPDVFVAEAAKQGLTLDFMRDRIRKSMITQRLIGRMVMSKIVITEDDITSYFAQSGGVVPAPPAPPMPEIVEPEPEPQYEIKIRRVRFGMIIYDKGEDANKWAKEISSGRMSFEAVARKVSQGPNAEGGGDLGMINIGDLAPGLRDMAYVLQKGQVTPVLDLGEVKAQFKLIDLVASKREIPQPKREPLPQPELPKDQVFSELNEEASASIEDYLRRPLMEARFEEYVKQLRNKAIIDIKI